jgi:UDP-glucose 4-epimerase
LRVLVTGAAGFLGRHVLASLSAAGHDVIALVHKTALPESPETRSARVITGDLNDAGTWRDAVSAAGCVCHFAACIPPDYEDPGYAGACLQANALATLELARAASQGGNRRFIYASAGNAYVFNGMIADERTPLYPADRATWYLASKITGEVYVEHLRRVAGLQAICLRIATPYGFGMAEKSAVAHFMKRASAGLPLEVRDGGIPLYDFVHAADVARMVAAAVTAGPSGVYNVGSGVAHSIAGLAQAVAETWADRNITVEIKPPAGPAVAGFGALSVKKATETWGYRPVSLREGLAEYRQRMDRESS